MMTLMLKVFISLLLSFCIFQAAFAARMDIESHLNSHNHLGRHTKGDVDHDRDGNVESRVHANLKALQFIDLVFVKITVLVVPFPVLSSPLGTITSLTLSPQTEPPFILRPPILVFS